MRAASPKRIFQLVVMALFLGGVTFLAYYHTLNHDWLLTWDDKQYLLDNPHIRALSWDNLYWQLTAFYMGNWTPLTWLSHTLTYIGFGLDPWGHHLVNVIFHCLNTMGIFVLAIIIVSIIKEQVLFSLNKQTLFAASLTAFLFGIHPQHVESVAWVAERKDVLYLFFTWPALIAYLFYTSSTTRSRIYWYLLSLLSFIFALLSKPMIMTLPVILILLDIYPLKRIILTTTSPQTFYPIVIVEKIPFFLLSLTSAIITLLAQQQAGAVAEMAVVDFEARLFNATHSLMLYLSKLLFPVFLSPYYPFHSEMNLAALIALVLITVLCGYAWYRKQYYGLIIWLFYLVTLFPILGFFQVGSHGAADRFVYLANLPFYLLVGIGTISLYQKTMTIGKVLVFIAVMSLSVIGFQLTQQQTLIWKNDLTLWNHALKYNPENYMIHKNMANAYFHFGNHERTIAHLEKSIQLNPNYLKNYQHLATVYLQLRQPQKALAAYQKLVERANPRAKGIDEVFFNMALIYANQDQLENAVETTKKALQANPNHQKAQQLLSIIQSNTVE